MSEADALTVTVCAVVYDAPDAGAVMETVGDVVSAVPAMFTETVTAADVAAFRLASNALAVQVWLPLTALVTAQLKL